MKILLPTTTNRAPTPSYLTPLKAPSNLFIPTGALFFNIRYRDKKINLSRKLYSDINLELITHKHHWTTCTLEWNVRLILMGVLGTRMLQLVQFPMIDWTNTVGKRETDECDLGQFVHVTVIDVHRQKATRQNWNKTKKLKSFMLQYKWNYETQCLKLTSFFIRHTKQPIKLSLQQFCLFNATRYECSVMRTLVYLKIVDFQ